MKRPLKGQRISLSFIPYFRCIKDAFFTSHTHSLRTLSTSNKKPGRLLGAGWTQQSWRASPSTRGLEGSPEQSQVQHHHFHHLHHPHLCALPAVSDTLGSRRRAVGRAPTRWSYWTGQTSAGEPHSGEPQPKLCLRLCPDSIAIGPASWAKALLADILDN